MIRHDALNVSLAPPSRGARGRHRDPTTVSAADRVNHLDGWERLTFWLVLTTLAVAVMMYAWTTSQMTLAELGQPTERAAYEAIEPAVSEPTGLPFSQGGS